MKKVLIAGSFDLLHPGHIYLIKQAKELGGFLTIVIARDQNIYKLKGQKSYFNERIRLNNLNKLKLANKIILGNLEDKLKVIREEKPGIIALGYDQYPSKELLEGIKSLGIKVVRLSFFKNEIFKSSKLRKVLSDEKAGFLNINKPINWSSHDVIAKLRSIIGIKQIGHAGTLDPLATGVLICGIGKATKLLDAFHLMPKTYEAIIRLGVVSDTYDRTGKILSTKFSACLAYDKALADRQVPNNTQISIIKIRNTFKTFIGKQKQLPPMFSAKKIQGKKLYEIARKGKVVERRQSEIEIYDIKLLKPITNDPLPIFKIRVICSTGTYIRTLAHDIGQKLDTGAILEELKRTAIGDFKERDVVQLNKITKENYSNYLIKPLEALEKLNLYITNKT